jgi:hypothetical protein
MLKLKSLWFYSLFFSSAVHAFPENIRYGYNNCQTCHISPTGGGILNKYGRGAGETFMYSWSYEGMSKPSYGLFNLPNAIDLGGDIRRIQYEVSQPDFKIQKQFLMQADVEASIELISGLKFVSSGGQYGETPRWERRRYYAIFENTQEEHSSFIRIGKFFPAYGILVDDHTRLSRRSLGFDQGQETFNIETGGFTQKYGIVFTRVLGQRPSFSDDGSGGVDHVANGNDGFTLKLSYFKSKYSQYSINYLDFKNEDTRKKVFGLNALVGITKKFYTLLQYDHGINEPDNDSFDIVYSRFGWVIFKGFHLKTDFQFSKSKDNSYKSYGIGYQWLIFPHFNLQGYYDITETNGVNGSVWLLMFHYFI